MSNRMKNTLLCIGALVLGALIYILFRGKTWISHLFDDIQFVAYLRNITGPLSKNWLCYYIPDLLWAFSLSCGIQAINDPERKGIYVSALIAFCCGVVWEVLQRLRVMSGTADVLDVLMYLTGSFLSILVNCRGENRT